ncbi:uncharacterized protein LOC115890293 [Sitophilus oryzae]|uniref:Uncharacterized protein LOC115890293 n=1 Tax=Sitophilus oryzae TaxID=7048 RepID=A0A6J2YQL4_SITOR|nr:uncharacterized protein LOC115890293 [Sitophilus oryzae]XP_030766332.1 uncharacterized protein LOC115890293 [Sitophilus oryzae]XP_030766333.1 uncharacterized protein LOC115890293 [Sitophilus oryzae]
MPGRRCAVFSCNNSAFATKRSKLDIIYHNFPKAKNPVSKNTLKEWVLRCRRADNFNPANSSICSIHFKDTDYDRDLRNELLGLPVRKLLKKSAIPTLNLPGQEDQPISEREKRFEAKVKIEQECHRKEEIDKVLSEEWKSVLPATKRQSILERNNIQPLQQNIDHKEYEKLLDKYNSLRTDMKVLKRKLLLQNKQLKYYKKRKPKKEKITFEEDKSVNALRRVFTNNQIDMILKRKKRINWSMEEMNKAFALYCLCKKSYVYVKTKLNYPLPGLSTLRKWALQIKAQPDLLGHVCSFLKEAEENVTDHEIIVINIEADE